MSDQQTPKAPEMASILQEVAALKSPEPLRERVKQMTSVEFQSLMAEMKQSPDLPKNFAEEGVQKELEDRMEREGVTQDVRQQWQTLKANIETKKAAAMAGAEKGFVEKMMAKGGGWMVLGSVGITILSWLGFKKAKALKESLKTKGYLRTAIEGAKEHPIFAAFLGALGLKAGTDAYNYVLNNRDAIEGYIGQHGGKTAEQATIAAMDLAAKVREGAGQAKDFSIKHLVKGLAWATGGTYDEETGVVTMPSLLGLPATLRPPVVIAWQSGVRGDVGHRVMKVGHSLYLVENRLQKLVHETSITTSKVSEASAEKKLLAQRALELLKDPTARSGGTNVASGELDRILKVLEPDLQLRQVKPIDVTGATPEELNKRREHLVAEMEHLSTKEITKFNGVKSDILNIMDKAELDIRKGNYVGSAADFKASKITEVKEKIKTYTDDLRSQKLGLSNELADVLGDLHERAGAHLDNAPGGGNRLIEQTRRKVESLGYKLSQSLPGKFVTKGIAAYSFLPLAMEATAAMQSGPEGDAAKKALTKKALINDGLEAGLGFVPVVGELMDFRAAIMGKDLNGRELSTLQRVTSGAFGTLGTASIALGFFTGGTSIGAFKAFRGAMAAKKALKITDQAAQGIQKVSVTAKSLGVVVDGVRAAETIDTVNHGVKAVDGLRDMYKTTQSSGEFLHAAQKLQHIIHGAQNTMQLATYAHLGYEVASGMTTIYGNVEDFVESTKNKVVKGAETVQNFLAPKRAPELAVTA